MARLPGWESWFIMDQFNSPDDIQIYSCFTTDATHFCVNPQEKSVILDTKLGVQLEYVEDIETTSVDKMTQEEVEVMFTDMGYDPPDEDDHPYKIGERFKMSESDFTYLKMTFGQKGYNS